MRIISLGLSLVLLATPALALPKLQTLEKSPIAEKYKAPLTVAQFHEGLVAYQKKLMEQHDALAEIINKVAGEKMNDEQKSKFGKMLIAVYKLEGQIDAVSEMVDMTGGSIDE